jgi:endonuclease G
MFKTFGYLTISILSAVNLLAMANDGPSTISSAAYTDTSIVVHKGYTLKYNELAEVPLWVVHTLTVDNITKTITRTNNFREDHAVTTRSASPTDYTNSGFDRGHMSPAADFSNDADMMSESFLMSNICPQYRELNAGVWADLEGKIRELVKRENRLHIVTGPIIIDNMRYIGKTSKVVVPQMFFKVIYDSKKQFLAAYIMPNSRKINSNRISDYSVSRLYVQALVGLDFNDIVMQYTK